MNYLEKLQNMDLIEKLRLIAKEYCGPGAQSVTLQMINDIKKQALLEAIKIIEADNGRKTI
jgi:hypothetical protein